MLAGYGEVTSTCLRLLRVGVTYEYFVGPIASHPDDAVIHSKNLLR